MSSVENWASKPSIELQTSTAFRGGAFLGLGWGCFGEFWGFWALGTLSLISRFRFLISGFAGSISYERFQSVFGGFHSGLELEKSNLRYRT